MNFKDSISTILLSFSTSTFFFEFYQKFEPVINLLVVTLITLLIEYIRYKIKKLKE